MGKRQKTKQKKTPHTRSQEVSPFPAGDHKAAMNRQDSMTDTKHKQQNRIHNRSTALDHKLVLRYQPQPYF